MEKGKKQHNSQENLLLCLTSQGSRAVVPEQDYISLGSLFEAGRVRSGGRDLVLVDPCAPEKPRLTFRRTPLGMLAPTVLSALGREGEFVEAVLANAAPRCGTCDALTERAEAINPAAWPQLGYIAVVLDGVSDEVSLEEQCELLGAERALVKGRLLRVDDLGGRLGEPVVNLIEVSRHEEVSHEVESWLHRGASAVRLVHFSARDAEGVNLQRVSKRWRCSSCGSTFPVATRHAIEEAAPCSRCRGEGWLLVEDDRFIACEDCDAFGCVTPFASYECAGFPLKHLAQQAIKEVVLALPEHACQRFLEVARSFVGDYPCGAPVELLSKSQRTQLSILSAGVSRMPGLTLAVDGGVVCGSEEMIDAMPTSSGDCRLVIFAPTSETKETGAPPVEGGSLITLRDLTVGPLAIPSLELPIGRASVVQGAIGSGKSLLLREIARRFSKKRKFAHLAMWGGLKRARYIRVGDEFAPRLGELLGIDFEIASEMARLRAAQERGLSREDFLPARSQHLCAECEGMPSDDGVGCPSCQGSLFHHRVGGVSLGSATFSDIMRLPLSEVRSILWSNETFTSLVDRLPGEIQRLTLASSTRALAPATRRFLAVFAPLVVALAGKASLAGEMLLIDEPFGTAGSYQALIIRCIKDLEGRGATIVCAGVPKALENIFSSVVRLAFVPPAHGDQRVGRYFDVRMARRTEVRSDKQE